MRRLAFFFSILMIFLPGSKVLSQKSDPTIVDFKIQALYRAAKLNWKTREVLKDQMLVKILRADTFEEGPYEEVDAINLVPDKNDYEYVDKTMGVESKYYYKLVIKETGEFFGPIPTRPYFSPPATQWQPPERQVPPLALREARR